MGRRTRIVSTPSREGFAVITPLLAFGIPGVKELILVALVALAFYGRSGLLRATPQGRAIAPWLKLLSPVTQRPRSGAVPKAPERPLTFAERFRRDRLFWALALTAAAGVAAWVATRLMIQNASPAL